MPNESEKSPESKYDAQKVVILAELRQEKHLSLDKAAGFLGLDGKKRRESLRSWELGNSAPKPGRRPELIGYLFDSLGLRSSQRLQEVWNSVMVEEWKWSLLSKQELEKFFPGMIQQEITPFTVPALPPQGIVGRKEILKRIMELLDVEASTLNVPPVALLGMGGIGKTTLAIAAGHSSTVTNHFRDGVLWVALGPKPSIRTLLDRWGQVLGLNLSAEPDVTACQTRLKSYLLHRRVFLMIDDVWEIEHARSFMLAGLYGRTLLTTRELPIATDLTPYEHRLRVDVLNDQDALALLRRMGGHLVIADPESARQLCEKLGNLPLALTLAGRLLANVTGVPSLMKRLVTELIERRQARMNLLQTEKRLGIDDETVSLQAILGMSVERLERIDQERFAMLSAFGGEPLTWDLEATERVWVCLPEEAEETMNRFIHRGLVEHRPDGRYQMHALLADYANELREKWGL